MAPSESKTLTNLVKARGLLRTKVTKLFNKLSADEADISEHWRSQKFCLGGAKSSSV